MSALTVILRVLEVLTTLLGCNIYRYAPQCGKFRRRRCVQLMVTLLHYCWLYPWLILASYLHLRWFIVHFLVAISSNANVNNHALLLVYFLSALIIKYQNIVVCLAIVFIYKYYKKQVRCVLNEFVVIYREIKRLEGRAPCINWWLYLVYVIESITGSILVLTQHKFRYIPYVSAHAPINYFLSTSSVMFVSLQPFVLSLVAHLGFLLLQSFYQQQLHLRSCHTATAYKQLLAHYVALMKLKQNFELLVRPFVWMALISELNYCMLSFHLLLYDQHMITHWLRAIASALLYPMCFMYQSLSINAAEKQFGNQLLTFRKYRKKQLQLQFFCLYKLVLFSSGNRSNWNIFLLNRSHILECLYFSWILAMFTNSLLVSSPDAWLKHCNLSQIKHN